MLFWESRLSAFIPAKKDDCLVYYWPISQCVANISSFLIRVGNLNQIFWHGNNHSGDWEYYFSLSVDSSLIVLVQTFRFAFFNVLNILWLVNFLDRSQYSFCIFFFKEWVCDIQKNVTCRLDVIIYYLPYFLSTLCFTGRTYSLIWHGLFHNSYLKFVLLIQCNKLIFFLGFDTVSLILLPNSFLHPSNKWRTVSNLIVCVYFCMSFCDHHAKVMVVK